MKNRQCFTGGRTAGDINAICADTGYSGVEAGSEGLPAALDFAKCRKALGDQRSQFVLSLAPPSHALAISTVLNPVAWQNTLAAILYP